MNPVPLAAMLAIAISITSLVPAAQSPPPPHLRKDTGATQLVVGGRPFVIRGGELGNSAAPNLDYPAPFWDRFRTLRLNTILAPCTGSPRTGRRHVRSRGSRGDP